MTWFVTEATVMLVFILKQEPVIPNQHLIILRAQFLQNILSHPMLEGRKLGLPSSKPSISNIGHQFVRLRHASVLKNKKFSKG